YTPLIGQALWRVAPDFVVRDALAEAFAPGYDSEGGFDRPDQLVEDYRAMTYTSFDEGPAATDEFREEAPLDDRLTRAAVPLLVIFGAEDQIIDADRALQAYSGVPGVRTELLEGLGHAPQVEDPEAVARLLEDFAIALPDPGGSASKPKGKRRTGSGKKKQEGKSRGKSKKGARRD
ncbi:MAG: alpha/beta fold hydrolase, partial [Actinomycetota bacterium]|nr:alpha/beta fold hydrolase [Actinomycetota bacterium]